MNLHEFSDQVPRAQHPIPAADAAAAARVIRTNATDGADQLHLMQACGLAPYEACDGYGRTITRTPNITREDPR